MSNTRHIAAKPQDWQVRPRPPRPDPDPTPPPPPPEPPPPGVDVSLEELGAWFGIGYHASYMVSGYMDLVALRFAITTPSSVGEVTLLDSIISMRGGTRLLWRNCELNESDDGNSLAYIGGPDYPAPYGMNIPEGGRLIIRDIGYMYYFPPGAWMTMLGITRGAWTNNVCPVWPFSGQYVGASALFRHKMHIIGSGIYGQPTRRVHYASTRMNEDGSYTTAVWNPPHISLPEPPMPEHTKDMLEWMFDLPLISVHAPR